MNPSPEWNSPTITPSVLMSLTPITFLSHHETSSLIERMRLIHAAMPFSLLNPLYISSNQRRLGWMSVNFGCRIMGSTKREE